MPRTFGQGLGFLLGFALALWLSPFGVNADEYGPAYAELEAELHVGVNAVREGRHMLRLVRTRELDAVALAHSQDMARRRYFAHENPEGQNPLHRLQASDATGFSLAGENLGITSEASPNRQIIESWLQSPVHRQNLLAPTFNATGIGIARSPDGSLIYTQVYVTYPRGDSRP